MENFIERRNVMKHIGAGIVAIAFMFMFATNVSAHVTISPKEAVIGYSMLHVSVPTEKDIPTVSVRLVIPEGVDVHGIAPVSGWTHNETRENTPAQEDHEGDHGANGRITEVLWSGGSIKAGEFVQFPISVSFAGEPKDLAWNAYQTYADGSVVAWDGVDEKRPAPKVAMVKQSKLDSVAEAVEGVKKNGTDKSHVLSIVAIAFSVAAFVMARRGNK